MSAGVNFSLFRFVALKRFGYNASEWRRRSYVMKIIFNIRCASWCMVGRRSQRKDVATGKLRHVKGSRSTNKSTCAVINCLQALPTMRVNVLLCFDKSLDTLSRLCHITWNCHIVPAVHKNVIYIKVSPVIGYNIILSFSPQPAPIYKQQHFKARLINSEQICDKFNDLASSTMCWLMLCNSVLLS